MTPTSARSASRTHGRFGSLPLIHLEGSLESRHGSHGPAETHRTSAGTFFPLGLQRVDDLCLVGAVEDRGDPERGRFFLAARLGDIHPPDRPAP